ncbi:hypothetical protein ACFL1S_03585 [Pseudomonadota bacterium]
MTAAKTINNERPLSVVCMKWDGGAKRAKYREYSANHVFALREMVQRNLSIPHEFCCITDDPGSLQHDMKTIEIPARFRKMRGCYPKLALFSKECAELLCKRVLYVDLDTCIAGSLDPLIPAGDVDFKVAAKRVSFTLWDLMSSKRARRHRAFFRSGYKFNAALMSLNPGSLADVLNGFDEKKAQKLHDDYFVTGGDQVWLQHKLDSSREIWTTADGVYSYSSYGKKKRFEKPDNLAVMNFGGSYAPWLNEVLAASPWIREYYPLEILNV